METSVLRKKDIKQNWHIIDASTTSIGRIATQASRLLMGKNNPHFVPTMVCGDKVIVINTDKLKVTGKKLTDKNYYRHSGFADGFKVRNVEYYLKKDSTFIIRNAIEGMLPKNKLRAKMLNNLYLYKDENHKHEAQIKG